MNVRCATCVVLLLSFAACSPEPLDFADWTIPVPEGTPIIEYAHVPNEGRTETLELERNLVLTEAFDRQLYQPRDIDVALDGRIFVLDSGNHRVVAFDADGTPLYSFGAEGQGPGEFKSPRHLCLTDDRVVIYDTGNSRLSVFRLGGELVADHAPAVRLHLSEMWGVGEHLMLIDSVGADPGGDPAPWVAGWYSLEGSQITSAVELESVANSYFKIDVWNGSVPLRAPWPVGVIARDGTIHATTGDEYQVLRIGPEANASWALRVAYEAPEPTEEQKEAAVELTLTQFGGMVEGLAYEHFVWPDRYAAIENLEVDGHGNLYVFPHAVRSPERVWEATEPVPVDVYSPEGERLFSGMSPIDSWNSALGDYLYRVETDLATDERVVVRYRLVEPF